MNKEITFPQFRKYAHNRTFFKILSLTEWEEIEFMGGKGKMNNYQVKIMPDRNYLHDMTFDYEKNWLKIEAEEYESKKSTLLK